EIAVERPLGRVLAHRAVLGQIVTNLLSNAVKFTKPDTPPRVRVRSERLHGMQQYPGTGIGLAIVQKGAIRLGGQAGVESEPGAGSRFWVELAEAEAT